MKVGITLDDGLLARIDSFADANYMTRSGFLSLAATQYLSSQEAMLAIKSLSFAMQKIADSGAIDADTQRQLDDFSRLAKMFVGS